MKKNIKLTVGLVCLLFATYIHAANLDIIVSAIPSEKGKVAIALYNSPETFPKKGNEYKTTMLDITSSTIVYTFENITSGNYAAVSFHDENSNKKLDKRFGMPTEAYGFSNGAIPKLGPPKFSAAMFFVTENKTTTINIKLKK